VSQSILVGMVWIIVNYTSAGGRSIRMSVEPMCKSVLEACVLGVVYDAPRGF
jgi:hypothetical protein